MNRIKFYLIYLISFNLFSYGSGGGGGGIGGGGGGMGGGGGGGAGFYVDGKFRFTNGAPRSDGSILLGSIVGGILFLAIFLTWYFIYKNKKKSKESLEEVLGRSNDPIWNIDFLKARAEKIFFIFIDSINEFDIEKMKDYVTDSYFNVLVVYKNSQLNKKEREVFERVELTDIELVEINDFKDDSQDSFRVVIKFEAINFHRSLTGKVYGSEKKILKLKFLFSFKRKDNEWFLNELFTNPEDYSDQFRSSFEE